MTEWIDLTDPGRDLPGSVPLPAFEVGRPAPVTRVLLPIDSTWLAGQPVPPREWHVDGMIPARTVTLLGGDGGTGKSLLALQLAFAGVYGLPWLGREVRPGPVLFVSAEDDMDELHRRMDDIAADAGRALDCPGLHILSLAGEDAVLAAPEGRSNLLAPTDLHRALDAKVAELQPSLVILDTLADLFGGEENQRAQARAFIGLLKGMALKHRTTGLLLAHPSLSGMASGSGTSGSTAWNNSVRSRLYFERMKGDEGAEPDPDARVLKVMKSNYGRIGEEIGIRWSGGVFKAGAQESGSAFAKLAAEDRADDVFMALLATYAAQGRRVSDATGRGYAPGAFAAEPRASGITNRGFEAAMRRLFNAGRIRIDEIGPPSKRVRSIVATSA